MDIAILGAGPAGLYAAYLIKRRMRHATVRVFEQNPADATFGFGVVFSDRALAFLNEDDPETYEALLPALETWEDIELTHRDVSVRIDGIGFASIGRLHLLQLLQTRAREVGAELIFDRSVTDLSELMDADLLIGADGVNSFVRRQNEAEFGTTVELGSNRFVWYGTTRPFPTLTQTFREATEGHFTAHHYRFSPGMSTFIIEVDEATFFRAGFDSMGEAETKTICERVFAPELAGHSLISNRSIWRQFPRVANQRWTVGNTVLVGDALRTAHFSIGSGTRLAMEDAIALVRAIAENPDDLPAAMTAYESNRRPVVEKLVRAANASAEWYEHFPEHMELPPWELAMSYMGRTGRIDRNRLRQVSPGFVDSFESRKRPEQSSSAVEGTS